MCCGCAVWQPSGTHDTPLISCVYLPVWETVAVGQNMREGVQVLVLCIWCSYGKCRLWVSPFISSLITVPTGKGAQKSLSNANVFSLVAQNTHRLAGSLPHPFYSIPPLRPTPFPQHTHPSRLTVSQGDQTVDS